MEKKNIFFERENVIFSLSRYVISCFRKYKKQDINDVFLEMKCEEFTVLSRNIAIKHAIRLISRNIHFFLRCIFFSIAMIFPKIEFVYNWKRGFDKFNSLRSFLKAVRKYLLI